MRKFITIIPIIIKAAPITAWILICSLNTIAETIKVEGNVIVEKGTLITKELLEELKPVFANGYGKKKVLINDELDNNSLSSSVDWLKNDSVNIVYLCIITNIYKLKIVFKYL